MGMHIAEAASEVLGRLRGNSDQIYIISPKISYARRAIYGRLRRSGWLIF